MSRRVQVSAPSRVHFGLLRLQSEVGPSFGGLGLTIDRPRTVVELQWSDVWKSTGPESQRALAFAQQAWKYFGMAAGEAACVRVCEVPAAHTGLGTGTQLALAVARGVATLHGREDCDAATLAASVGRGRRSAVGSHAFTGGGLIWETGYDAQQSLGQLGKRIALPDAWRILLFAPGNAVGLHGQREVDAFAQLPAADVQIADQLQCLAEDEILPAAEQGNLDAFAAAIYRYGELSGSYFSTIQGGLYASEKIAWAVNAVRNFGVQGVGQSSWGPTVFAILPDEAAANTLVDQLSSLTELAGTTYTIAAPDNHGAKITP